MGIPLIQQFKVATYIAGRKLRRDRRYPLVLMLEPLFQCNLACAGCGKIDYPKEILQKRVSVEDALHAVDECGAYERGDEVLVLSGKAQSLATST